MPMAPIFTEIIIPVVLSLSVLSYLSRARSTEEFCYTLVSILATKGLLEMGDLERLGMFKPHGDVLNVFRELLETVR